MWLPIQGCSYWRFWGWEIKSSLKVCKRWISLRFKAYHRGWICLPEYKGCWQTHQSPDMGHCWPRKVTIHLILLSNCISNFHLLARSSSFENWSWTFLWQPKALKKHKQVMRIRDKIIHNSSNLYRLVQNSKYVNYPENKMNKQKNVIFKLKLLLRLCFRSLLQCKLVILN